MTTITSLDRDLFLNIVQFLGPLHNPKDVLALFSTCKTLRATAEIVHEYSDALLPIKSMLLKRSSNNAASFIGSVRQLRIRQDVAAPTRAAIQRGASAAKKQIEDVGGYMGHIDKSLFVTGQRFHSIVMGGSNEEPFVRPFVSIICHVPYNVLTDSIESISNAIVYTLFQRLFVGQIWCINQTRNISQVIKGYKDNFGPLVPSNDFPSIGSLTEYMPILQSIMENSHKWLHCGYQKSFEIRHIVQLIIYKRVFYLKQRTEEGAVAESFTIAKTIADYAAEPQDYQCRRCEVQDALGLRERIESNQDLSQTDNNKRLKATVDIYHLIDGYAAE